MRHRHLTVTPNVSARTTNTDHSSSELLCSQKSSSSQRDEAERREVLRVPGAPPFSALVVRLVLVQQSDVGEREVASFALAFALPLAVHVDLGHFHRVPHLLNNQKKKSLHFLFLLYIIWHMQVKVIDTSLASDLHQACRKKSIDVKLIDPSSFYSCRETTQTRLQGWCVSMFTSFHLIIRSGHLIYWIYSTW